VTPYAATDLFDLKWSALNNDCFFTHPDHPVQHFSRTYDASFVANSFTWAAMQIDYPCFRSTNQSLVTATPNATTGTGKTITFSANVFTETLTYSLYEGARIQLTHRRTTSSVDMIPDSTTNVVATDALSVLGNFSMTTYGLGMVQTITIQRKDDAGTWQPIKSFEMAGDRNVAYSATQLETAMLRVVTSSGSKTADGTARVVLEVDDSRLSGIATITGISFAGATAIAAVDIDEDFDDTTATTEWAIEAWAPYAGYPRSVAFHEQRLWLGGTELDPTTFWGSRTNDFFNYRRGAYDADALSFTLAASEGSTIQSMLSHEALILFTQTEEWTASTSQQTAITPSNIFVRRQSRFGSAFQQAFLASNNIIFLQRGARKIREFVYTAKEAGGASDDLSLLAEHITLSGVKQVAYAQQPDPVAWMVTNDGLLISLTYEATQNVIAWARHPTEGTCESVAIIYGDANASDEVWVVANRTNGRFVERIDPDTSTLLETGEIEDMTYLDSAVRKASTGTFTKVLANHLDGMTVGIVADGYVQPDQVVTDGGITLAEPAVTAVVGLPFTSLLQPAKTEMGLDDGTAQDRKWVCKNVFFNVWKTMTFEYADDPDAEDSKWFDTPASGFSENDLRTGMIEVRNMGSHRGNVDVTIRQRLPYPCNILAMIPEFNVLGE